MPDQRPSALRVTTAHPNATVSALIVLLLVVLAIVVVLVLRFWPVA